MCTQFMSAVSICSYSFINILNINILILILNVMLVCNIYDIHITYELCVQAHIIIVHIYLMRNACCAGRCLQY